MSSNHFPGGSPIKSLAFTGIFMSHNGQFCLHLQLISDLGIAGHQTAGKYKWSSFSTSIIKLLNGKRMRDESEHLLPVKAIHRAYRAASRRQRDITRRPQVTVREMMPRMMKKSVVIHSGGSCGGMQVRSRPWMVWHCRTRPTVREPGQRQRGGWEMKAVKIMFSSSIHQ